MAECRNDRKLFGRMIIRVASTKSEHFENFRRRFTSFETFLVEREGLKSSAVSNIAGTFGKVGNVENKENLVLDW